MFLRKNRFVSYRDSWLKLSAILLTAFFCISLSFTAGAVELNPAVSDESYRTGKWADEFFANDTEKGDLPYEITITNMTGDSDVDMGETLFYHLRINNNGMLNDAYRIYLHPDKWAIGLYADELETPLPFYVVVEPGDYYDVYLKVFVPNDPEPEIWETSLDVIEVEGTWIPAYFTVTTRAIKTVFEADFEVCPDWATGWTRYGNLSKAVWECEPASGDVDGYLYTVRLSANDPQDTWVVTPLISIPAGQAVFSFDSLWQNAQTTDYARMQGIYVSELSNDPVTNPGHFKLLTQVINDGDEGQWNNKEYDISEFAEKDVYIAFTWWSRSYTTLWSIKRIRTNIVPPRPMPFSENFDPGTTLKGWNLHDHRGISDHNTLVWGISETNAAGGYTRELRATNIGNDNKTYLTRFYTPPIDISGIESVSLSFLNEFIDGNSAGLTAKVQYSTDGGANWTDTGWQILSKSGNVGPQEENIIITGLTGKDILTLSWMLNGIHRSSYFVTWSIDNVLVDILTFEDDYAVVIENKSGNQILEPLDSFIYQLKVRNMGNQNDTYSFTLTDTWADGLYTDAGATTELTGTLSINSGEYTYIYLKVTVPADAEFGDKSEDIVTAYSTNTSDSITVTTTAVTTELGGGFDDYLKYQYDSTAVDWQQHATGYMYHERTATGQNADNWLVSPAISLEEPVTKGGSFYLKFKEAFVYPSDYYYHGIWISAGSRDPVDNDYTEFIEIVPDGSQNTWYEREYDIGQYAGEIIYIAFVYRGEVATEWRIDEVVVYDSGYEWPKPTYPVTITVRDYLGDPLPSMNIWIWDQSTSEILLDQDTNALGQVSCMLPEGNYEFDVWDYYQCYEYHLDSFTVVDTAVSIDDIYLNLREFDILFEIIDQNINPITGASIDITGATNPADTDIDGKTTTKLTKGRYDYTVSQGCYNTISASVDIGIFKNALTRDSLKDQKGTYNYHLLHQMDEADCKVIFTAKDGSEPLMGVQIHIDGRGDTTATDSEGYTETYLTCGDYDFIAEAGNYDPYYGSFSVTGSDSKNIIEIELDYDPVYIDPAISLAHPGYTGIWLWSYDDSRSSDIASKGSSWTNILQGVTAKKILAGDITGNGELELIALLSDYGLWYYSIQSNLWTVLIPDPDICTEFTLARTQTDEPLQIIASLKDNGVYKYSSASGNTWPSSWERIVRVPADILIADNITRNIDGIDELAIAFHGYPGLYIYSFKTNNFSRITTVSPSQILKADITDDGYNELIISFDGLGVYLARYEPGTEAKGISYPVFDIMTDIASNEWSSKGSVDTGLQFTRITWGSPDIGHSMGTGDIRLGFGEEIFLTHAGFTYYYSYDTMSWSALAYAPIKTIISGRFTGYVRGDLIVCDSNTGDIYLYRTKNHSWELLVAGGNANAMTAME